jgi:hypothetical protein
MSGNTIQDFIDKANALDALRKRVDERFIKFFAAAKCQVGVDSQQRESHNNGNDSDPSPRRRCGYRTKLMTVFRFPQGLAHSR